MKKPKQHSSRSITVTGRHQKMACWCFIIMCLFFTACTSSKKEEGNDNSRKVKNDVDISIPGSFEPAGSIRFDSINAPSFFAEYAGLSSVKNERYIQG